MDVPTTIAKDHGRIPAQRVALMATFACLILALLASAASATSTKSASASQRLELQHALDQVVAAGVPGAVVLARQGYHTTLLTSGYGNLEQKTHVRATDRFRVGSTTKTFVATVVLQLVGEGKLTLNDTVERRLPGAIPNGKSVTVRQLLNMTSGLFDYLNDGDTTVDDKLLAGDLTYRWSPSELSRSRTSTSRASHPAPLGSTAAPATCCSA